MLKGFCDSIFFIGVLLFLSACGRQEYNESDLDIRLSSSMWANKPSNSYMSSDKFFFTESSSTSFFSCLKSSGISEFIAGYNRGLSGGTQIRDHINNAQNAGLRVNAYYAFNGSSDLTDSAINGFLNEVSGTAVKRVWIDIETNPGGLSNINRLYEKVCVNAGYSCGVYTNFGGMTASRLSSVGVLNQLPLWFADDSGTLNPNRSLSDFYGWNKSRGRQIYLDDDLCGKKVDVSIMETALMAEEGGDVKPIKDRSCPKDPPDSVFRCDDDSCNVRPNPGTGGSNEPIGKALSSESFPVIQHACQKSSGMIWYKIDYKGTEAWVWSLRYW